MTEADDMLGRLLDGKYRIRSVIGTGGFGKVYEAVDEGGLGHVVAIKVLHAGTRISSAQLEGIKLEADTLRRLQSPHIVQLLTFHVLPDGTPYIVMERVQGRTLTQVLGEDGLRTPEQTARFMLGVLDALRLAHAEDVLHLDLKPGNAFVVRDRLSGRETAKVIDFGISQRVAADGSVAGAPTLPSPGDGQEGDPLDLTHAPLPAYLNHTLTLPPIEALAPTERSTPSIACSPGYGSPEQCAHYLYARYLCGVGEPLDEDDAHLLQPLDGRSDLFSLGVVAFQMLTGQLPFDVRDRRRVLHDRMHVRAKAVRDLLPEAPKGLARCVDQLLEIDRELRPATAEAARAEVQHYLDTPRRRRRQRQLTALLVVVLGVIGWLGWKALNPPETGSVPISVDGVSVREAPLFLGPRSAGCWLTLEDAAIGEQWPRGVEPEVGAWRDWQGDVPTVGLHREAGRVRLTIEDGPPGLAHGRIELAVPGLERSFDPVDLVWIGERALRAELRLPGDPAGAPADGAPAVDTRGDLQVVVLPSGASFDAPPRAAEWFDALDVELAGERRSVLGATSWSLVDGRPAWTARLRLADLVPASETGALTARVHLQDAAGNPGSAELGLQPIHEPCGLEAIELLDGERVAAPGEFFHPGSACAVRFARPVAETRIDWWLEVLRPGQGFTPVPDADGQLVLAPGAVHDVPLQAHLQAVLDDPDGPSAPRFRLSWTASDAHAVLGRDATRGSLDGAALEIDVTREAIELVLGVDGARWDPDAVQVVADTQAELTLTRRGELLGAPNLALALEWSGLTTYAAEHDLSGDVRELTLPLFPGAAFPRGVEDGEFSLRVRAFAARPDGGHAEQPDLDRTFQVRVDTLPPTLDVHEAAGAWTLRASEDVVLDWSVRRVAAWPGARPGTREVVEAVGDSAVALTAGMELPLGRFPPDDLGDGVFELVLDARDGAGLAARRVLSRRVARAGPQVIGCDAVIADENLEIWATARSPLGVEGLTCRVELAGDQAAEAGALRPLWSEERPMEVTRRTQDGIEQELRAHMVLSAPPRFSGLSVTTTVRATDGAGRSSAACRDTEEFGLITPARGLTVDFGSVPVNAMRLVPTNTALYFFGGRELAREREALDAARPNWACDGDLALPPDVRESDIWMVAYPPQEIPFFYLDERAVSVAQYLAFVEAADGYRAAAPWAGCAWRPTADAADELAARLGAAPDPDADVTGLRFEEAQAYAAWLGKRLPSLVEFEYAVRGPAYALRAGGADGCGDLSLDGIVGLSDGLAEWTATPYRDGPGSLAERIIRDRDDYLRPPPESLAEAGHWIADRRSRGRPSWWWSRRDMGNAEAGTRLGFRCALSHEQVVALRARNDAGGPRYLEVP